ncbi:hypothetical protein [Apibacter sp. HY039]|uniref:hypothetical protein n=1 Tax=Apibacter sp. HY039 TaxID=2501476 RepID=UPI000FEBF922|nr:hypothetical protein [Apibacter sp. HY039]
MQVKDWKNTRIYKVNHTLEVKERSQNKQSRITFDMGIGCLSKEGSIQRIFTKENYRINSQLPNDHHIRLVCDLEQALYPLVIEVSPYENYERIPAFGLWKNDWWKKSEEVLKNKYEGDFAENLRNQYREMMETEEKLKQKIQEEAFWRLYFLGISEEQKEKSCRWNILKAGTLYFQGAVQTAIKENEVFSRYTGIPELWEDNFTENLNRLLKIKKNTPLFLTAEKLNADCTVTAHWEKNTGKLLAKAADVKVYSIDQEYSYSEKIEINFHSISMREITHPRSFSFQLSEKEEDI